MTRAIARCLVVMAAASVPASARAATLGHAGTGTFGRPFAVTPAGTHVDDGGAAAVSAGGRVVATWTAAVLRNGFLRGDRVEARLGDMSGRFGRVQRLSEDTAAAIDGPLVAVGADGTVAVAWVQGRKRARVRVAVAPDGRRFGGAQTVGAGVGAYLQGISVGQSGVLAAAWTTTKDFRSGRAHLALGRPGHLRSVLDVRGFGAAFAAAPDGSALMIYDTEADPPVRRAVLVAPGGAATGAAVDAPEGQLFAGPGGFAIGMHGSDTVDQRVATSAGDGTFGAPRRVGPYLGDTEEHVHDTIGPFIALPGDGSLSAAWEVSRALNGDNDDEIVAGRILAASAPPAGSFGPPQRLSRPGRTAEDPQIAAVGDTTVVVWREGVGILNPPFSMNFSARHAGRTQFGPTLRFPADGWIFPVLDAAGQNLVASWYPFNGYRAHHERLMLALWREP